MSKSYQRQDHLYTRAKAEGYRSRAAYKLLELNDKFRFLRPGAHVLDLGAWPGSWVQVAARAVGEKGLVIGIDLAELVPFPEPQVQLIHNDASDPATLQDAIARSGRLFDVVLSDMSPKLSGIREVDRAGTEACAVAAVRAAGQLLAPKGCFVVKLFKSPEADALSKILRGAFERTDRVGLDATRRTSNEWYFVGISRKNSSELIA